MAYLVADLPERVRAATLSLGLAKSERSSVPRRLAQLLTMPLFDLVDDGVHETAVLPDAAPIDAMDFAEIEASEPKPRWTQEGILKLHSVLLEESLRALGARGTGEQKREILEWIFEPSYVGTVFRHGREVQVLTSNLPFSFVFCCKLEGMDPDHIRSKVLQFMPAEARKFFH
jgi:hypothetical protein